MRNPSFVEFEKTYVRKSPFRKVALSLITPFLQSVLRTTALRKLYDDIRNSSNDPAEFARAVLKELGVSYQIIAEEIEKFQKIKGPIVFLCNKKLENIESFIVIDVLGQIRKDFRLVSHRGFNKDDKFSDSLMYVDPFTKVPTDQKDIDESGKALLSYLQQDGMLAVFPTQTKRDLPLGIKRHYDLTWPSSITQLIRQTSATVIPIYFHGKNRLLFQLSGILYPRFMKQFPYKDVVSSNVRRIYFHIGKPITPRQIDEFEEEKECEQFLKSRLFLLSLHRIQSSLSFRQIPLLRLKRDEDIIAPLPKDVIVGQVEKLGETHKLFANEQFSIYAFEAWEAPELMREIGRLREVTFREVGEGSGKACDTDSYDEYYIQLVLWDHKTQAVAGGYRLGRIDEILHKYGKEGIYTCASFQIDEMLLHQISPALEMGRSFIVKEYQRSYAPLLMLWSGIGRYLVRYKRYRYLFGPVSISAEMNKISKTLLVEFLSEKELAEEFHEWVRPKNPFRHKRKAKQYYNSFSIKDLKSLQDAIKELENNQMGIPILFKHYLKMGAKMLAFNIDPDFSNVLDCLMMTDLLQTNPRQLRRYMGKEGLDAFLAYHKK